MTTKLYNALRSMIILLRGVEFFAHHGVSEPEKKVGQHYRVDLEVEIDAFVLGDDLGETLDYGAIGDAAILAAQAHSRDLVESVAQDIARAVLALDQRVRGVQVELLKLHPPVQFTAAEAGVRLTFRRDG